MIYICIQKIKDRRKEKLLTQKQLARKIGTSQSYISNLENYKISPNLKVLTQIGNVLGVSPKDLFEVYIKSF